MVVTSLKQDSVIGSPMNQWTDISKIPGSSRRRYRAIFISDIHLGTRTAQAVPVLDFLKHHEADSIYLVGDIVDFWKVRRGPHWPQAHNDVIQELLRRVRHGTRLVFIPGNHDEGLRDFAGMHFGGIEVFQSVLHRAADGKRYLVMHGDEFDVVIRTAKWLAFLGDRGYELALWLNNPLNWVRRHCGLGYWSLSAYLKYSVKRAVNFIGAFEEAVAAEARRNGVDGIICGHIHHPADRDINGIRYLNCGDWVESCSALIEHESGRIELIRWNGGSACVSPPQEAAATSVRPELQIPKLSEANPI